MVKLEVNWPNWTKLKKLDEIKNWTELKIRLKKKLKIGLKKKLKIGQNWKLDKIENWTKLKTRQN